MKRIVIYILFLLSHVSFGQDALSQSMSLAEYLGYVKAYHPIVKQANLIINESEAKLLKERGDSLSGINTKDAIDRIKEIG